MPNRHGSSSAYRYGFQGQEKDDELKGEGNSLNYTFRMHDPRVGRFFAVDPLEKDYPWYTPYSFSGNKVIAFTELEGMEESWAITSTGAQKNQGPTQAVLDAYRSEALVNKAINEKMRLFIAPGFYKNPEQAQDASYKHNEYSNPTNIIAHGVGIGFSEMAMDATGAKVFDAVGDAYKIYKLANRSSLIVRTINKLDNGVSVINKTVNGITANRLRVGNANGKIAVIGRGQKNRVDKFAKGIGAETWDGFDPLKSADENLKANKAWVKKLKDEKYTVFDVGLDPKYSTKGDYYQTPNSVDYDKGDFYDMESSQLFGDIPKNR